MRGALFTALSLGSLPFGHSLVVRQDNATSSAVAAATATSGGSTPSGSAAAPKVTIYPQSSTGEPVVLEGTTNPALKQDSYLGIPFAAPPVGDLRLAFPQDPSWNVTTFSATNYSAACLQAPSSAYDVHGQSEDCLYLNVYTPQGIDYTQQSLPVMVWVYGGAFTSGTASVYDPSVIMAQAQLTNKPIVFVSVNYRLGVFGFPGGKEVSEAGIANLGLRDVKKGLEWVQNNIWAFGGDAGSVTLFGQSAGAILTSLLYLDPNQKLFKSAIMESGAQAVAPIAPTDEFWQIPFDLIQNYTKCSSPVTIQGNGTSPSRRWSTDLPAAITCLKYVPAEDLLKAQLAVQNSSRYGGAFVFAPSIDGDTIPASPHELLAQGQFSKAPFISGNNYDEGTIFVPLAQLNYTQEQLPLFVEAFEPVPAQNATVLGEIGVYYPDDPSVGSPFGTGNETFGLPTTYKQAAAILGDATFQANRRWFLQSANQYNPGQTWSYQWARAPPGTPPREGVPHSAEVIYVFGVPQAAAQGQDAGAVGLLGRGANYTDADVKLSQAIINYWLNFAYYTNPNGDGSSGAPNWPNYGDDLNLLFMNVSNVTVVPDTYREAQIDFFNANPDTFNYKRWLGLE